MNLRPLLLAPLVAALAFAVSAPTASARVRTVTAADAPRSLPEQGPVSVQWEDPAQFTEIAFEEIASDKIVKVDPSEVAEASAGDEAAAEAPTPE